MAKDDPGAVTPAAAVARHLEWLEFALEAARDEEIRRRGRLDKASDKNRSKRTVRLGEVSAEIRELAALVAGLRDLQARAEAAAKSTVPAASAAPRRGRRSTTTKPAPARRTRTPKASSASASPAAPDAAAKPVRRPRRSGQTPPSS
jgi:septal ring factor EnvC (AmiA/AmiB activator)